MIYETVFYADAKPEEVFEAFHRYKISRDPKRFFPSKVVKWRFEVLTDHVLGLDAIYDWKIWLLGIPVLDFKEKVVEWEAGKGVAYRAISGWEMYFRIGLNPEYGSTRVRICIDLSLGNRFLERSLRPFIEWGLGKVCRRGLSKEGIPLRGGRPLAAGTARTR